MTLLDLPPMADDMPPVILPGLLTGLGITPRQVPAWITDPDAIKSIASGLYEIDDDLTSLDTPSLKQIEQRIAGWACFYLTVQQTRVADLERRVAAAGEASDVRP